ncbi:50S ribosomal protein L25 [Pseudodesulfovibrio sp.]|nr:50S ribosomal protein L25 [Pseudodesulfovibrio sp.]
MAELLKLNVEERKQLGKGPNRRLRATGMVPGIYYDAKGTNIPVKVAMVPLQKAYAAVGSAQVFELVLEKDGTTETHASLLWRVRNEPVSGMPEHVDFFGVDLTKTLKVAVHFELIGTDVAPGVEMGGVFELFRDTIEVICKPMDIPEAIIIDVASMELNDSIRIEEVVFPDGVEPVFDENYAIVSLAEPREIEEEVEEDELLEGEEGMEGEEGEEGEGEEGEESSE